MLISVNSLNFYRNVEFNLQMFDNLRYCRIIWLADWFSLRFSMYYVWIFVDLINHIKPREKLNPTLRKTISKDIR